MTEQITNIRELLERQIRVCANGFYEKGKLEGPKIVARV